MDKKEILSMTDHTRLKPEATWALIQELCDEGVQYGTASVCVAPSYVKQAKEYLAGKLPVCTVIGFPLGNSTTAVKVFEAKDAIANGADEIDMVINIGWLKDGKYDDVLAEIKAVKEACGDRILKVIIETCLLTEEEKIKMCEIVSASGAEFIKTSTGFSKGGATAADIRLLAAHVAPHVRIKASGGIGGFANAEELIWLGASRLGTSRLIKLLKKYESSDL